MHRVSMQGSTVAAKQGGKSVALQLDSVSSKPKQYSQRQGMLAAIVHQYWGSRFPSLLEKNSQEWKSQLCQPHVSLNGKLLGAN